MRAVRAVVVRLASLFRKRAAEREIDDELQSTLQFHIDEEIASGLSPGEARRQALVRLGGIEQTKLAWRDRHGLPAVESAWRDVVQAIRGLGRNPVFTIAAVLTLFLAVGANTAILSVADAVMFRPLPYDDPGRIFVLENLNRQNGQRSTLITFDRLEVIDEEHDGLDIALIGDSPGPIMAEGADGPERVSAIGVTTNYFEVLGVEPLRGRLFNEDDGAFPGTRVVLTHASWQQRFGSDDSIIGSAVTIGSRTFDVLGVLPPGFLFTPSLGNGTFEIVAVADPWKGLDGGTFYPVVRLASHVRRDEAQAEMDTLLGPMLAPPDRSLPFMLPVRSRLYPVGRPVMATLLAASGMILLLGSANLAHMFLARGRQREGETAVRAALGASRLRLTRPVIIEGLVLGATAALLAVGVTSVLFDSLLAQVPAGVYGQAPVGVNLRVGLLAFVLGIAGGIVSGLLNLRRTWTLGLDQLIRRISPTTSPAERGRWMVGVQVALSVVLVFGAGVASREFVAIVTAPLGFEPENVVTVTMTAPVSDGQERQDFYARAVDAVSSIQGVVRASAAGALPISYQAPDELVRAGGRDYFAGIVHALPGYWETAGIPLLRGRTPDWNDVREGAEAAVVSESAARALYGDAEPIGATFTNQDNRRFRVVGVVGDVNPMPGTPPEPTAYVIPGPNTGRMHLVIRARSHDARMFDEILNTLRGNSPAGTEIVRTEWWTDRIALTAAVRNPRFHTVILGGFGTLALLLTSLGVAAVVGSAVAGRRREIGIRLALGARPERLWRMIVGRIAWPVVSGLAAGVAATLWISQFSIVDALDTETSRGILLLASVVATVVVAGIAVSIPARRAGRIDPMAVLRTD